MLRMKPWDLNETYALVKAVYGAEQQMLVKESTQSVVKRQQFARYHYREALRLSKDFERKHLQDGMLIDIYRPKCEKKLLAFEVYIIKAGAHITAAIQSIHSIPDILAHAVFFATGHYIESHAGSERKLALPVVVRTLKKDEVFHSITSTLAAAQSGSQWCHLAALANVSKHRTVIRTALNEDWTGKRVRLREIHLSAFEREGKYYPPVSAHSLLEQEYLRLTEIVLSVGHELNSCLRKLQSNLSSSFR